MRAVLDTNVLLSGLLWRGAPHSLIEHVQAGTLAMVSSPVLLAELTEVISRAKFDEILASSNTSRGRKRGLSPVLIRLNSISATTTAPNSALPTQSAQKPH